ncbi:MAG TPA: amidohydrolase family protein [Candidatus Acidoferrum sp.]|jgi:predicted TIM-barrel fold metal-dependent hydrolase
MFPNQVVSYTNVVRILLSAVVLIGLVACKPASNDQASKEQAPKDQAPKDQAITYTADPNAGKRMTLLLKDFAPNSMLHTAVHEVPRAKFPVIDVHNHVNDAAGINGKEIPPAEVIRRMDAANVQKIVILTGMWGDKLQAVIDKMVKPYPDRFMVFTQIDYSKIDDPNFAAESVAQLDDAVRRGARGMKVLKDLGLGVKDKSGKLVPIDDPRLDPVWEECGKLGIPVGIHTSDPEAFFTPIDNHNERYEELNSNPTWSFYGPQFPSKDTLLAQRNHMFEKHPHTKFIALHVANWPENLDVVSAWLDKYPNMLVEFGARQAELGRQPRRTLKFFRDYQDRILFGTDSEPEIAMYANYFRWLERPDEYFQYWGYPGQGRWEIYGLELPDKILQKVYNKNATRLFAEFKGAPGNAK